MRKLYKASGLILSAILLVIGHTAALAQGGGATPDPDAPLLAVGSANADWVPIYATISDQEMVYVPAGCFMMGSTVEEVAIVGEGWFGDEVPQHEVCITEPFWIGRYEVTNAQYRACVEAGVCEPPSTTLFYDTPDYDQHPVVFVDWERAQTYAEWLDGSLLSEAQWEYAARGPEGWTYPWGDEIPTCEQAHMEHCGDPITTAVGPDIRPTGVSWVGAQDMAGNVWEWLADGYIEYVSEAQENPTNTDFSKGPSLRGGAFYCNVNFIRSACRGYSEVTHLSDSYGFRIMIPVDVMAEALEPVG